ncbi:MAG TPA: ATP-grasp domain-containing protein [Candidatus Saccharimonadales bacterium]|nr:ATP-grasp domain-containing protein [Candidatus Saccharimonadales bacterium]
MSNGIRIAVSGTGGGAGQSVLKALAETDYDVVALDGEPLGAGLYTTNTSYLIPYANSPELVDRILEICQQENVKLYFPGLDAELPILTQHRDRFKAAGVTLVVSSPDVVELSDNKQLTYDILVQHGFNVPKTYNMAETDPHNIPLAYPFVLKEREGGARSQNLYVVKSEEQLEGLLTRGLDLSNYVAQEYIEGDEYTCGSVNFDGTCYGVIVMRRILRDGDTYKCFSVRDELIENEVKKIAEAIKPFGPCNVQLRVKDGKVYVFEINARCSGTTGARALCGFNEPKMIADFILQGKTPEFTIKEQSILRYWKELVVENDLIETMKANGKLTQENPGKL